MKYLILSALLILCAISCSTVTFQPFTDTKYPPTTKVDLYTDKAPEREYIEIGRIIVREDAFTGEKNMVKWAIEQAKKVGADGLIWTGEDKDLWAIPAGGSIIAGDTKKIIFIAIKYKN
ncbi:MAG: hypothetical protein HPY46_06660 [Candidatus Aminicenantes bacterium]|nr:hypothetical protein [Candidatus Aminicenantes bacterium]